jgi:hypothetical protein
MLLTLGGCTGQVPSTASAPPILDAPPATGAELSRFSVPLQYDFSAMLRVVERAVPITFGSIDSIRMIGTDTRRHYAFEAKRGKFAAFGRGGRVHLRATLAYRAQVFYKPPIAPTISAGCGGEDSADRPRIVVEVAAPLSLSPNWHLASHARERIVRRRSNSARQRQGSDRRRHGGRTRSGIDAYGRQHLRPLLCACGDAEHHEEGETVHVRVHWRAEMTPIEAGGGLAARSLKEEMRARAPQRQCREAVTLALPR